MFLFMVVHYCDGVWEENNLFWFTFPKNPKLTNFGVKGGGGLQPKLRHHLHLYVYVLCKTGPLR